MVTLTDLLKVCPNGAWMTEEQAVQVLGLYSKKQLQVLCHDGLLPHVYIEHGSNVQAPPPYNSRPFFFLQAQGTRAHRPVIGLLDWIHLCREAQTAEALRKYTGSSSELGRVLQQLQISGAVTTAALSPGNASSKNDYRYSTSAGIRFNKAASNDTSHTNSVIITRPDGTKVRRVRGIIPRPSTSNTTDTNHRQPKESNHGRRPVLEEGEVDALPDGKRVRCERRTAGVSSSLDAQSEDPKQRINGGIPRTNTDTTPRVGGSTSVEEGRSAIYKESAVAEDIFARLDGTIVRRVKKSRPPATRSIYGPVEIITKPDGTRVKRIRKTRPAEDTEQC